MLLSQFSFAESNENITERDKICLYEHPEYQGEEWCYGVENISWIGDHRNDQVSSIKLYGRAFVTVFGHGSFKGKQTKILANTYKMGALDDSISSFKVGTRKSNNFACLFENNGFRGTPYCLEENQEQNDLDNTAIGRNSAESLLISGKVTTELYEYPYLDKGRQWSEQTRSSSNIGKRPGGWISENIDSFKVLPRYSSNLESAINLNQILASKLPLPQIHVLSSHNSFNSTAYFSGQLIPGPNHRRSIIEQLQLGVRFFELDVRSAGSYTKVCHSVDCHFFTTSLRRILGEVESWLKGADDSDVVFFFLQDDFGGDLSGYLGLEKDVSWLGDMVYQIDGCQAVPNTLSFEKIRKAGKRIFFYKSAGSIGCQFSPSVMIGQRFENNIGVASIDINANHFDKKRFLRSQECINYFCNDHVTTEQARIGIENGVNALGLDMLEEYDLDNEQGRLNKQLWAFGPETSHDAYSSGRIASFTGSGNRFMKVDWNAQRAFACRLSDGRWKVSSQGGNIWEGSTICQKEYPNSTFDVPQSPVEAKMLRSKLGQGDIIHVNLGFKSGNQWLLGKFGKIAQR
ncbi:peptidase inhibitor family I36 protein [Parashewanella spongiae]|nr:peptidase inhibitor family I36 protein [Parashewanella spongiae]